jgi:signal-transduction protein with cAMP-binding, CBS, and nucleotidyltransferase domain
MSLDTSDMVESLITRPAVFVHLDDTLRQLAVTLTEESIGAAVVRGTNPLALVSERDVVRALAEDGDPDTTTVSDIMTEDVAVAAPTDPIADVVARMLSNEIRHMPIADDGAVIGFVSARDALARLAR